MRTYFATLKGILIKDIHCIRHASYKNMPDIRTLYVIPDDVLITDIHCIIIEFIPATREIILKLFQKNYTIQKELFKKNYTRIILKELS